MAENDKAERSGPGRRRRRIGHLIGLALFLILLGLWLINGWSRPALLDRDWVAFDNAGWRGMGLDWSSVYRASIDERWSYLYPPFAIFLAIPLGLLPYWPSYAMCVAMCLAGLWWSARRIADVVGPAEGRHAVFCSTLLCAPTTIQVIVTGQYSWIYLAALCTMAAAVHRGRDRQAGVALAALALKPNVFLAVAPLLVLRRARASLAASARALIIAVAVTIPFGLQAWSGFLAALRGVAQRQQSGDAPIDKQVTVMSFLHVVSGRQSSVLWMWAVWAVVVLAVGALAAKVWRRADGAVPALRLVGLAALTTVSLNPRLYFYDALMVGLPAAGWYLQRDSYEGRARRRLIGAILAAIGIVTFLFFPWPPVSTAVGPLTALWAVLESVDLLAGIRRRVSVGDEGAYGDPSSELVLAS